MRLWLLRNGFVSIGLGCSIYIFAASYLLPTLNSMRKVYLSSVKSGGLIGQA